MTPSGPILGLNKRRKIKLRSKLQPACSRAVYQQCVKNRGQKKEGRVVFPLFICCCFAFSAYFSFLFYDRGGYFFYLWGTWRALLVLGCKKGSYCRIPNKSNDFICLHLSCPIYTSTEAGGVNQTCHHSLCLSLWEWLWLWHKCRSKQSWPQWHHIYSFELLLLVAVGVIRHRSAADVFFPTENLSSAQTTKRWDFPTEATGESQFCWVVGLFCYPRHLTLGALLSHFTLTDNSVQNKHEIANMKRAWPLSDFSHRNLSPYLSPCKDEIMADRKFLQISAGVI